MKSRRLNNKGFGHIELFILVAVLLVIIGVGFYVFKVRGATNSKADAEDVAVSATIPKESQMSAQDQQQFLNQIAPYVTKDQTSEGSAGNTGPCQNGKGKTGARVEMVYVTKSSNNDYASASQTLRELGVRVNAVYLTSALKDSGLRKVRFQRDDNCQISITKVTIDDPQFYASFAPSGARGNSSYIKQVLQKQGLSNADRKYMVYVNHDLPEFYSCGFRYQPKDDQRPGQENKNNNMSYQVVLRECWDPAQIPLAQNVVYSAGLLANALGGPQKTAPHIYKGSNANFTGTLTDNYGILSLTSPGSTTPCKYQSGTYYQQNPMNLLDCNFDDYFAINPGKGSYLAKNWNIANSRFLRVPASVEEEAQ